MTVSSVFVLLPPGASPTLTLPLSQLDTTGKVLLWCDPYASPSDRGDLTPTNSFPLVDIISVKLGRAPLPPPPSLHLLRCRNCPALLSGGVIRVGSEMLFHHHRREVLRLRMRDAGPARRLRDSVEHREGSPGVSPPLLAHLTLPLLAP
jgi:hypothetical protein